MTLELSTRIIPFSRRLFWSIFILFIAFAACMAIYQERREKVYKIELLNTQLQSMSDRLNDFIIRMDTCDMRQLDAYVLGHSATDLRVTLINDKGNVFYDNWDKDLSHFKNHLGRKEVKDALENGSGYSIVRHSESLNGRFFYSAKYYPIRHYIIRMARPYTGSLQESLKADRHFLWFAAIISIIMIAVFYRYTQKIGTSITQLKLFALKADRNLPIKEEDLMSFPNNELGEISQHIIQMYKQLLQTKEDLYIEREKLITHLQISREGLGVFTKNKKEIIVNSLFTQYINIISDKNLNKTEDFLTIPEMETVCEFLNKYEADLSNRRNGEKQISYTIDKDGRIFSIDCVVFQDESFEVTINDITQEEEQARVKKQLTQNIAHELKTPVSSIHGYLETILTNPNITKEQLDLFINRCYAQSDRLSNLLRDISVLTRMDEAPNMIELEPVNIGKTVKNIINEVALNIEEKHITVYNNLSDNIIINGNQLLLYSIFRNLIDNTIAYAGRDISITINCFREDDNYYYFSFADTGIGVAPEHLNRLFERFYRIDKGRSRKSGGTGLGLAIVKNAVLIHGGTIFAKNNPGGGLEFIFTLKKD
ncbi:MAG: sensor histidine kinase [Phocaeicola sp.]|uniref:sensor histidine kinase n=1 Tax=Phocaeicola TaxID=909656 RepID=UPI00234F6DE1|nr:HAMP domain-containing sensor histidine kinase [Phocaeicola oris]MCE2615512.1 HAMP domain-containing histidine kinase [Phocaeicola oris]